MTDDLAEQVANLPDNKKIEFLLNFAGKLADERDRLAGLLTQTVQDGEWLVIAPKVHAAILAERDRLRAVVEALRTGLEMVEAVTDIEFAHGYARAALHVSGDMGGSEDNR